MKYEDIKTVEDLCDYISLYKRSIFVREEINGKWDNYSLAELPADKAIDHALEFVKGNRIPHRIKD